MLIDFFGETLFLSVFCDLGGELGVSDGLGLSSLGSLSFSLYLGKGLLGIPLAFNSSISESLLLMLQSQTFLMPCILLLLGFHLALGLFLFFLHESSLMSSLLLRFHFSLTFG